MCFNVLVCNMSPYRFHRSYVSWILLISYQNILNGHCILIFQCLIFLCIFCHSLHMSLPCYMPVLCDSVFRKIRKISRREFSFINIKSLLISPDLFALLSVWELMKCYEIHFTSVHIVRMCSPRTILILLPQWFTVLFSTHDMGIIKDVSHSSLLILRIYFLIWNKIHIVCQVKITFYGSRHDMIWKTLQQTVSSSWLSSLPLSGLVGNVLYNQGLYSHLQSTVHYTVFCVQSSYVKFLILVSQ
jgi:hypothetical protein